ncbi:MAG: fimbrillin family protein [Prevotella sp.]|nr:fimbrillin family protein [Prevotella sp.]
MKKLLTAILLLSMSVAHAGNYAYQPDGRMSFEWNSNEAVELFSTAGTIMKATVVSVDDNDKHWCNASGNGWAYASNVTFYCFAPYSLYHKLAQSPYTALPVTYTNQTQSANGNTEHLAAVDYMAAQTASTDDALSIPYNHLGCIMRIAAYVPEGKTFSTLMLTTKDNTAWFAEEATINATNNTITPTETTTTATLSLNNITVASGDSLITYLMLPPTDLTGKSLLLTATAKDGTTLQTYIEGCNMLAGKVYPVNVGEKNYFRTSADNGTTGGDDPQVLSLRLDIEDNVTTDNQILAATAYAPDFALDTENEVKPFLLGDANLDGTVDVTDVVLVVNHYQADTTDELDLNVCDIDGDGVIDVTDVVGIVNIYHSK